MTDDLEKVKKKRLLQKDIENHSNAEFKDVLNTFSGRAVLSAILKECGVDDKIPTPDYETLTNSVRALGKRDVGLWLKNKILTASRSSVILMENEDRERTNYLET